MLSDSATQLLHELQGVSWIPTYNVSFLFLRLCCAVRAHSPAGT
jgi:hypothetical protein